MIGRHSVKLLRFGVLGVLALSTVAAAPAFAAQSSGTGKNGTVVARTWMAGGQGSAGDGPAHWHAANGGALIGLHGRHLSPGASVEAVAFDKADCQGSPVSSSNPTTANSKGHAVLKLNLHQSPGTVGSAGLRVGSKVVSCANEGSKH
jgi:hypothetical protein